MTRRGKIARLPHAVREELNGRLADGGVGKELVDWLNGLPEVQRVLTEQFHGEAISERNLSRWKIGGFTEWQQNGETREWVGTFMKECEDMDGEAGDRRLADRLATPVAVELFKLLRTAGSLENLPERRKAVLGVARRLAELRRADHLTAERQWKKERQSW